MGPNVKRLVIERASMIMVPPGSGGINLALLTDRGKLAGVMQDAAAWVQRALTAVKSAPDNHYGEDDEAIAGEILRRIQEKKGRS